MQINAVLIYVKSCSRRALRYAHAYQAYWQQQLPSAAITLLASSPCRYTDIGQLRAWVAQQGIPAAAECLVIGGDGSVNIAAQALAHSGIPMSVVPSGTGNDFTSALGLKRWRWRMSADTKVTARAIGQVQGHYFVNHAGAGLSVALQQLQSQFSKTWLRRYSYTLALLRYLWRRPSKRCAVTDVQQRVWEFQVAAVNTTIGGGITVYPTALSAQQLGIIEVPKVARWRQVNALWWILRKRPQQSALLHCYETTHYQLGDSHNTIEIDGDPLAVEGPLTVTLVPNALLVRLPEGAVLNQQNFGEKQ